MNNNQMNFDPITGQPINQNTNNINTGVTNQTQTVQVQPQPIPTTTPVEPVYTPQPMPVEPVSTVEIPQQNINHNVAINPQQQIQNIPTVEQSKQEFINNTQTNNIANTEEKKSNFNITFIVILFIIIFAAIFFLFPYLLKVL